MRVNEEIMRNNNLPLLSLLELSNKNASFVSPGKLAPFRELVNKRRFYNFIPTVSRSLC